ncbi:MAG: ferredoxin family protein [Nitrososphaera sp.]|nr:ferredoxin family protein [Nitrososphaera sp.]
MPIDPDFQMKMTPSDAEGNMKTWKSSTSALGIRGTQVAVDLDSCVGDGACIEVCPANVFDWQGSGDDRKALPVRERDCIYCYGCEAVCPKFAIRVAAPARKRS